jgi:hypothetical protein
MSQLDLQRGAAAMLLALMSGAATSAPVSIYTVEGSGFTSLNRGITRAPLELITTNLPGGGKSVAGGDAQEMRVPGSSMIVIARSAAAGEAFSKPGSLGAFVRGAALGPGDAAPGTLGGRAVATFRAQSTEYIPITSSTLPVGALVDFTTSFHVDGETSSELPGSGPYRILGRDTGFFSFIFTAFTVNGMTEIYNNDALSSGTILLPNAALTQLSPTIDFGQTFNMTGKVGDFLVLTTQLGVGISNTGNEASILDFSNTVKLFADAVTPGISFVANGHNYASTVPIPASLMLFLSAGASLFGLRRFPALVAMR